MAKTTDVASSQPASLLAATLAARGVLQVVASDERVAIAARASAEPARLAALRVWAGMDQRQ